MVSKPSNQYKFEFEEQTFTPKQLIEWVKNRAWKHLAPQCFYQRLFVNHHSLGRTLLIVRKKFLKNGTVTYDILICNRHFYNAKRIHNCYCKRRNIELQFKYYKQHLNLGQFQFRKIGAIQSGLYCVAIAGIILALFTRALPRKLSFKAAFKLFSTFFQFQKTPILNNLQIV
jgi:hypothetical protein